MGFFKEQIEEIRELYCDMIMLTDFSHEDIVIAMAFEFETDDWVIELIVYDLRVWYND